MDGCKRVLVLCCVHLAAERMMLIEEAAREGKKKRCFILVAYIIAYTYTCECVCWTTFPLRARALVLQKLYMRVVLLSIYMTESRINPGG